jgi:DNA-binding transcriptional LysR family regulator
VLDWLKTFLAVYRTGSVTEAARAAHLSQPTVSQHLRALESHIGRPLFERLPRGVRPTAAGHELAATAGPHLDLVEAAVGAARGGAGLPGGLVRLAGPAELLGALVVPALAGAIGGDLHLRIQTGLTEPLVAQLAAGDLDLVVATTRPRATGVEYELLYQEEFVLVAAPAWAARVPARSLQRRGTDALASAPLLAFAEHLPIIRRYWRVVFGERPRMVAALVAPDLRILLAAVIAGAGLTVLPRYLADPALAAGQLVQLGAPPELPRNAIHLASPRAGLSGGAALIRERLLRASAGW